MKLEAFGLQITLPDGWDGKIYQRDADGAAPKIHAANFPLAADDGDFGRVTTADMPPDGVFVDLFEYGSDVVGTALFAPVDSLPMPNPADFNPQLSARWRPNQSGYQQFFTYKGRAFCLYVLVNTERGAPGRQVEDVRKVLGTLNVTPA